jgi:hypothetical protein
MKLKWSNVYVDVTIVKNGEVLYKDELPDELANATFHEALNYIWTNADSIEEFDIRPRSQKYAEGGGVANQIFIYDGDNVVYYAKNLLLAKLWVIKNWKKYDELVVMDSDGDSIVITKEDALKDIEWLFSGSNYAKGGGVGGNTITDLKDFNPNTTKVIDGDANFGDYPDITYLGVLEEINGNASFHKSGVKNLGQLQTIWGDADFGFSQIKTLKKLKLIDGNADFAGSKINDLGDLQTINGDADFDSSEIKSLGKLEKIAGDVIFEFSRIEDLGNLKVIGGLAFWGDKYELQAKWETRDNESFYALIEKHLNIVPVGSVASGGGYGPFKKTLKKTWVGANSIYHSRGLAEFIGGFNDFKIIPKE